MSATLGEKNEARKKKKSAYLSVGPQKGKEGGGLFLQEKKVGVKGRNAGTPVILFESVGGREDGGGNSPRPRRSKKGKGGAPPVRGRC